MALPAQCAMAHACAAWPVRPAGGSGSHGMLLHHLCRLRHICMAGTGWGRRGRRYGTMRRRTAPTPPAWMLSPGWAPTTCGSRCEEIAIFCALRVTSPVLAPLPGCMSCVRRQLLRLCWLAAALPVCAAWPAGVPCRRGQAQRLPAVAPAPLLAAHILLQNLQVY